MVSFRGRVSFTVKGSVSGSKSSMTNYRPIDQPNISVICKQLEAIIKAKIWAISSDTHQLHYIPKHHFINIIIIFDTVYFGRNEFVNAKYNEFNSAAISLLWHALEMLCGVQINVAGIQRRYETWKLLCRIVVASTCRRSVQFGCYITWSRMANCVSVMIEMLPLFNCTISCHGRLVWKTSRCASALGGSRLWLVESTLFGDNVSLRLHREFSLKFNLSN